jgi:FtsH-binding integral membrane protein
LAVPPAWEAFIMVVATVVVGAAIAVVIVVVAGCSVASTECVSGIAFGLMALLDRSLVALFTKALIP